MTNFKIFFNLMIENGEIKQLLMFCLERRFFNRKKLIFNFINLTKSQHWTIASNKQPNKLSDTFLESTVITELSSKANKHSTMLNAILFCCAICAYTQMFEFFSAFKMCFICFVSLVGVRACSKRYEIHFLNVLLYFCVPDQSIQR